MPRIAPLTVESAPEAAKPVLEGIQKALGRVPNLYATLAQQPGVLSGFLGFKDGLGSDANLSPAVAEQIALVVGNLNQCGYCVSAHTAIGKMQGLTDAQTVDAQRGLADDPKAQAILTLAKAIVEREGFVTNEQVQAFRDAGGTDAEIVEILGHVVANIFTNYANHILETEVDFPQAALVEA